LKHNTAVYVNSAAVLGVSFVLLGAYYIQFAEGEFPCPLCLLQRLGMLALAFGAMLNLRYGISSAHYGISILGAIFGASVSARQIVLHIVPGTGGYGSPVLGLHLYTWAFIVFVVSIFLIGLMLVIGTDYEASERSEYSKRIPQFAKIIFFIVLIITAANVVTTFLECGLTQCPDNPTSYKY